MLVADLTNLSPSTREDEYFLGRDAGLGGQLVNACFALCHVTSVGAECQQRLEQLWHRPPTNSVRRTRIETLGARQSASPAPSFRGVFDLLCRHLVHPSVSACFGLQRVLT